MQKLLRNFTFNPKNDILSGLTVALALVPEAVAFAFVAGIDPLVGLYGAFMMGLITAVFPAANAGASFQDKSSKGEFHAVIIPITPYGSYFV